MDALRIAVPTSPLLQPLIERIEAVAQESVHVLRVPELQCAKLLLANRCDIALLSPLGYGGGVITADFRVIPSTACLLDGWTHAGSMIFGKNLGDVRRVLALSPADFLLRCGQIVLEEQYGIEAELEQGHGSIDEMLAAADAVLCHEHEMQDEQGLDISEEWDMSFGFALPLAQWVCRNEVALDAGAEHDERVQEFVDLTRSFATENLPDLDMRHELHAVADTEEREGRIEWKWTERYEQCMESTLHLLYQRQLLPEIPAIKVLGRD